MLLNSKSSFSGATSEETSSSVPTAGTVPFPAASPSGKTRNPKMMASDVEDRVRRIFGMVITTVGPRKPQRTSAFFNVAIEPECQMDSENSKLLASYPSHSPKTNTPAHKLQLETSFTSLLSPNEKTCKISLQSFGSHSSNNTNTITTNSLMKNDSCNFKQIRPDVHTPPAKNFIPWEYQSMLDDQSFVKTEDPNRKIDLIHDDWFGLAPLATPESLSEVSSISSRASSVVIHHDKANGLKDRWVPSLGHRRMHSNGFKHDGDRPRFQHPFRYRNCENSDSSDSYLDSPPLNRNLANMKSIPSIDSRKSSSGESSFLNYGINSPEHATQRSPRIIRRTPKIPKGLATAYEDSYSNQRFEEMMKARTDYHENTSNETNSFTSAKSQDLEKSSNDLYMTPVSSSGDSVRLRHEDFATPERACRSHRKSEEVFRLPRFTPSRLSESDEDINYHKPTMVILPTDENFPGLVTDSHQAPYLETDFSLSDPDLVTCEIRERKPDRKIKFDERVRSGVSFDQDYEFDIETESARLLDSNNASETSLCRLRGLQAQDSLYKDEDSIDETLKADDCLLPQKHYQDDAESSQTLVSSRKKSDGKVHYGSRSAEALPLLANINQEFPDKRKKYNFSFLTVNKGESSV